MALLALYFLTLFEFLFTQSEFDILVTTKSTRGAAIACLWGFGGMFVGRHLTGGRPAKLGALMERPVPRSWLLIAFWSCFVIGFFHMAFAVSFDFAEMVAYFVEPRFAQPWGRGRLGDWKALLIELGMLLYLIPPIAGIVLARRSQYAKLHVLLVAVGLLFTLFYGFSSGTRNIFLSYLVTFLIGYSFALRGERQKELIGLAAVSAVLLIAATVLMLDFRNVGLRNYMAGVREHEVPRESSMHVDLNLNTICRILEVFPDKKPFLGWEVPYVALIRPIPRAVWKGKPEGLSASIEDTVGANEGWTVAASFIGEAYMAAGMLGVIGTGILLGSLAGWWNKLASSRNSDLGILIYASGFFAAVITMRSVFVLTTAFLPTLAAILGASYLVKKLAAQALQLGRHAPVQSRRPPPRTPTARPPRPQQPPVR
jgi:hypothetical protein